MAKVVPGRYTARFDQPVVIFMIGMRINKLFSFSKWLPVFFVMPKMLRELYQNPDLGFLHYTEYFFNWRGITLVQYWRSFEDLERYARGALHLEAWKDFNRKIGTDGSVGLFHETYIVQKGHYESLYNNMPVFGLAKAASHVPATGKRETARQRLGGNNEPAVPPPNP